MLQITLPTCEWWDEATQEFIYGEETTLQMEHSLVSLSKWESKWQKPFLSKKPMTYEETIDYIRCMTLNQDVDPLAYKRLSDANIEQIVSYINNPMTATTFNERNNKHNREIVTAEIIYYWMISLNIPFECKDWHLNRLLTLVRVCNNKNTPSKKMSKKEVASQYAALNEARRKQLNTRG